MKNIYIGLAVLVVVAGILWLAVGHGSLAGSQPVPSGPTSDFTWVRVSQTLDAPFTRFSSYSNTTGITTTLASTTVVTSSFNLATNTPAFLTNPFVGGPSILNWVVCTNTVGTTSTAFALGTTTTSRYATSTTLVSSGSLIAAGSTLSWDPGANNGIVGSTTIITLGTTNGSAYSAAGYCSAQFTQI